jgi:hypothetical protein
MSVWLANRRPDWFVYVCASPFPLPPMPRRCRGLYASDWFGYLADWIVYGWLE